MNTTVLIWAGSGAGALIVVGVICWAIWKHAQGQIPDGLEQPLAGLLCAIAASYGAEFDLTADDVLAVVLQSAKIEPLSMRDIGAAEKFARGKQWIKGAANAVVLTKAGKTALDANFSEFQRKKKAKKSDGV